MNEVQVGLGLEFKNFFDCGFLKGKTMDPVCFCYWMQGYFELNGPSNDLTPTQVEIIKDHLALVFKKATPVRVTYPSKEIVNKSIGGVPLNDVKDWIPVCGCGYGQVVYDSHAVSC